jgi:hypothetical protein
MRRFIAAAEFVPWLERAGIDDIVAHQEMIGRRRPGVIEYWCIRQTEVCRCCGQSQHGR